MSPDDWASALLLCGLLAGAGGVWVAAMGGQQRLVGPVATVLLTGRRGPSEAPATVRWIFVLAVVLGAALHALFSGPGWIATPVLVHGLDLLALVGGGLLVGLGLRLLEGPGRGQRSPLASPRLAAIAAITATGTALATLLTWEVLA